MTRVALAIGKGGNVNFALLHPLGPEEKRLLKVTLCGVILNRCPDLYALVLAMVCRRDASVLALFLPEGADRSRPLALNQLTQLPRLRQAARGLDAFFERICYEFSLEPTAVSAESLNLGRRHRRYAAASASPVLDPAAFLLFFDCLQEVIAGLDLGDFDRGTVMRGWSKLGDLICDRMAEGFLAEAAAADSASRQTSRRSARRQSPPPSPSPPSPSPSALSADAVPLYV